MNHQAVLIAAACAIMAIVLIAAAAVTQCVPPATASPPIDSATACACSEHPRPAQCREQRRPAIAQTIATLREVAAEYEATLPAYMRLPFLAAVACGEGGLREQPTCGAQPECYAACLAQVPAADRIGKPRHRCIAQCGGAARCNDSGVSEGMFQLGTSHRRRLAQLTGDPLAAFDVATAARYYLATVAAGYRRTLADCPELRGQSAATVWHATAYRLGRGPTARAAVPAHTRCHGATCAEIPAAPRLARCYPSSRYVALAQAWSKQWGQR